MPLQISRISDSESNCSLQIAKSMFSCLKMLLTRSAKVPWYKYIRDPIMALYSLCKDRIYFISNRLEPKFNENFMQALVPRFWCWLAAIQVSLQSSDCILFTAMQWHKPSGKCLGNRTYVSSSAFTFVNATEISQWNICQLFPNARLIKSRTQAVE